MHAMRSKRYKAAELRDYFRDQCVDALQAKITKLDTISPTTAVIYPIVFPDRTELLVSLSTGIRALFRPHHRRGPDEKKYEHFDGPSRKRTTLEYPHHAQQLYDWLIRPLESELIRQKIQTLVFVPDGALRTIPFSALHDGKSFLIQQYAVAMTPGLYLTDPRPLNLEKIRTLAGGSHSAPSRDSPPSLCHGRGGIYSHALSGRPVAQSAVSNRSAGTGIA